MPYSSLTSSIFLFISPSPNLFYMVLAGQLPLERGGLSILGSVLILYAISELLSEEIKHIRGGAVSIKAFVGVALAAVIRKVLIVLETNH